MSTKITIMILLVCFLFSSCGQGESIAEGFVTYDSTEFIIEYEELTDRTPVFSVKYPPTWEKSWVADSGIIGLMFSSGDVEDAWKGRAPSDARLMIIPIPYAGQEVTSLFFSTLEAGKKLEPIPISAINGQHTAWAEYARNGESNIEAVIVRDNWALLVVAHFPTNNEAEFRPVLEALIQTLEIE